MAFASFTFPAPLDLVTKVYVSYDDEEEETDSASKTPSRDEKGKTPVALEQECLCPTRAAGTRARSSCAGACWTRRTARPARGGGAAGNGVRGVGRGVARKDGREKKYWFSQARNESVWKEPHKYYPVRFAQPE